VPDAISAGLTIAAETLKIVADTQEQKNAPDVKAAAVAQDEVAVREAATKAIEGGDLEEMRKLVAE
jgi:hypothetical protein